MKKKFLCLLLAILTISALALTSCSDDEIYIPSAVVETRTLSMYLMTDKDVYPSATLEKVKAYLDGDQTNSTECKSWLAKNLPNGADSKEFVNECLETAKQYEAVVEQINVITKKQFSIQLNIKFIAEDKYYDTLYKSLNTANSGDFTGYIKQAEVYENEYGVPVYQYPEVPEDHVDIFYVGDSAFYNKILSEELLSSLTDEINGAQKILKTVVYPAYFTSVTSSKNIYGVPFNIPAGNYKSILINKELADKYSLSIDSIESWNDLEDFLSIVAKYENTYVPIKSDIDDLSVEALLSNYMLNTFFWSVEKNGEEYTLTDDFSIIGYNYSKDATQNGENTTKYNVSNVLATGDIQNEVASLLYYFNNGYFGNATSSKKSAVELFEGDISELNAKKDEYYSVIVDVPHISADDVANGMFAVSGNTTSVAKSLEVVTYIFRNSELRNLFAYGIPETNYVVDSDGFVELLENNRYTVGLEKTGNILSALAVDDSYSTYNDDGELLEAFGYARTHDSETLVDPMFGFDINKTLSEHTDLTLDYTNIEAINQKSKEFIAQLEGIDKNSSIQDIANVVLTFASDITRNNKDYEKIRMDNYSLKNEKLAKDNGTSLAEIYLKWLEDNGLTTFDE